MGNVLNVSCLLTIEIPGNFKKSCQPFEWHPLTIKVFETTKQWEIEILRHTLFQEHETYIFRYRNTHKFMQTPLYENGRGEIMCGRLESPTDYRDELITWHCGTEYKPIDRDMTETQYMFIFVI